MGIRSTNVARNTLARANERRDWCIYADFAQALIRIARPLYADEDLGLDLDNTVYALDASTIDLCLSVFPWALFRSTKSAVKLHTLLDLRGNIPTFIHISDGKLHDVNVLDILLPEASDRYAASRRYVGPGRRIAQHIHVRIATKAGEKCGLAGGRHNTIVSARYFLITRLEAFNGRGNGDYLQSHDIEDIVAVMDGRAKILEEIAVKWIRP